MHWGSAIPVLRVSDLAASINYYVDVLGFTIDWQYPDIVSVSRDRCSVFLCTSDQSTGPTWVWIGLEDVTVEELHEQLRAKGAHIRQGPTNFAWAMEIQVTDLDNNVLRIGSSPKEGVPHGPWLDAMGREWTSLPEDAWELREE